MVTSVLVSFSFHVCFSSIPSFQPGYDNGGVSENNDNGDGSELGLKEFVIGREVELFLESGTRIEGIVVELTGQSILLEATGVWKLRRVEEESGFKKGELLLFPFEDIERIELAPKQKLGIRSLFTVGITGLFVAVGITLLLILAVAEGTN